MAHNLNIHMYSLDEILGLFDLTYTISVEDMKRAKKKVLMTHPDKSRLSPEYFLFYKKAFDVVFRFYENQQKTNAQVPVDPMKYKPAKANDIQTSTVRRATQDMSQAAFHQTFNQLFEENMAKPTNPNKNEWFAKDEPVFASQEPVTQQNMGRVMENLKQQQAAMIVHRGVENLTTSSGTSFHEDDEENDTYVSCDPFSKLKFDDLRKVHKDQTVLAVSERDFDNVQQYASVDHYMRERNKSASQPIDREEAERVLAIQEQQYREKMMRKEHTSSLRTMEYVEKNKAVLSRFLHLTNS
jgi:hypothetical protein